jgi:excisionase family DNA binding protein
MEGLMSPEQLAECLGLSKSFIYALIKTKAVPFFRIGKTVRFSPPEITQWLEAKRNQELRMPRKLKRPLDGGLSRQK